MSVQTSYGYSTPKGIPGGLIDLTPYVVDSRLNEADSGKVKFGMGVVQGTAPGVNIDLPATGATTATFEGITVNGFTQQHDLEGKVALNNGQSVGVLKRGRIYVRLAPNVEPAYGEPVHLIISGDNAGLFTETAETSTTIAISAKFIGGVSYGGIAPVELYAGE